LNDAVELAMLDGFTGLRTCGDMSWLLLDAPGSAQVFEYESFLNRFFEGVPAQGMCQYDRRRLPPDLIDHALATHPSAVLKRRSAANPLYRHVPCRCARRGRRISRPGSACATHCGPPSRATMPARSSSP